MSSSLDIFLACYELVHSECFLKFPYSIKTFQNFCALVPRDSANFHKKAIKKEG